MSHVGKGHCDTNDGYFDIPDASAKLNVEVCKQKCMVDKKCRAIAHANGQCSGYTGPCRNIIIPDEKALKHVTYVKGR